MSEEVACDGFSNYEAERIVTAPLDSTTDGNVMKMKRLTIAALCFMCAGCAVPHGVITPLENVVIDNKHALTTAGEQLLFEEFVKYKVLGSTFNLYMVSASSIEADTTEQVTNTTAASVALPLVLTKGVGLSNTYAANSGDTGKLTVTLSPLGNDPKSYGKVKGKFDSAPNTIFGITNRDDKDFDTVCTTEAYCFAIPNDHHEFAYLKDVRQLRILEDAIRQIPPPPKPTPAAACEAKDKT